MDWAQVLVLILGAALAVFLVLAIILISLLIKVSKQINDIAGSAQRTVHNLEGTVSNFSKATSSVFITKLISSFIKRMKN